MKIKINGNLAVLKQGTSFEYVSENRLFSGSDGYTLSISFPLRGCADNQRIFGHINRLDVAAQKVIFDCEIRHRNFFKSGSAVVTEISDAEVKCQFLEGRSEQNFDVTFDDIFINELDLGHWPTDKPESSVAWNVGTDPTVKEAVPLPWVNNNSESGNLQNAAEFADNKYSWETDTKQLSWMPFLTVITRRICEAVGYDCDITTWERHETYKYLLVCNCLPAAWDLHEYAAALPHWSVCEYFEKLELFLGGEFEINHRAKSVSFAFTSDLLDVAEPVTLDRVVEEHTVEVTVEDPKCEYLEQKNLVYKSEDNEVAKLRSCDWFIDSAARLAVKYDTLAQLEAATSQFKTYTTNNVRGSNYNKLFYARDVDAYFCFKALEKKLDSVNALGTKNYVYVNTLVPVNLCGGRIIDPSEDADETEVEFVPVPIDDTEEKYGSCVFLQFSSYNEEASSGNGYRYGQDATDFEDLEKKREEFFTQPATYSSIVAGEKKTRTEYYSLIYVGFWDGAIPVYGKLPFPYLEPLVFDRFRWKFVQTRFSLSLSHRTNADRKIIYPIDPTRKFNFRWLSDRIPNVRSLFYIRGKRYICEKITATFSTDGMSQLLKGVFYALSD